MTTLLATIKIIILTFAPIVFLVGLAQGLQIKDREALLYALAAAALIAGAIWFLPGSVEYL